MNDIAYYAGQASSLNLQLIKTEEKLQIAIDGLKYISECCIGGNARRVAIQILGKIENYEKNKEK